LGLAFRRRGGPVQRRDAVLVLRMHIRSGLTREV
jgi:hypothetical protein